MNYALLLTTMLLCLILIIFNRKSPGLYFSPFVVIGLLCVYALGHVMLIFGGPKVVFAILFNNLSPLFYLIGPMLYWHTQNILADRHVFHKRSLLHLIPFVVFFFLTLPYILTSFEYKIQVADQLMKDYGLLHRLKLIEAIPSTLNILFRPLHLIAYCIMCIVRIQTFVQKTDVQQSPYYRQTIKVKQSLFFLIAVVLINLTLYYLLMLLGLNLGAAVIHTSWIRYIPVPASLTLFFLPLYYFLHPEIAMGIPRPIQLYSSNQTPFSLYDSENEQELMRLYKTANKYTRDHWHKELSACKSNELSRISEQLHIPKHHLQFCQVFAPKLS
jgi:hypothetical protein